MLEQDFVVEQFYCESVNFTAKYLNYIGIKNEFQIQKIITLVATALAYINPIVSIMMLNGHQTLSMKVITPKMVLMILVMMKTAKLVLLMIWLLGVPKIPIIALKEIWKM